MAEDAILGRCVALKTLHRRYAEDISFRSRFKQEARVMASLDHENIVKVYDISQEGEIPFIVAEYVEGQDVGSVLREAPEGRLGERFTRGVAGQLLEALDYAHRRGVVHRDIKPSNILLTREGTVKVADFGIARLVEEEEAGEPGEIIGSARYMSPEQLRGDETTQSSDLYSVGIILYHFLTGRPPFSGDTRNVARQQVHKDPPPPGMLNKDITPALEAVILKALAKDPEDRYPSASAMLEDLRRSASPREEDPGETLGRRKRRHRVRGSGGLSKKALLVSSVAALLLLGGAAAAAGLGGYLGEASPSQTESAMMTAAQPATEDPPAAPRTEDTPETTGDETETAEGSANEAEQTNTELEAQLTAARLTPVPNVNTYFDYVAVEALRSSGFQTRVVYEYRPGYLNTGVTWGTDPVGGTLLPAGSTVTVYSTPVDQPQIPTQPQGQPPLLGQPQGQPQIFQPQFPI
ncbi:MAG: protein kinase [Rubrobacter sp.]|nr:protein kinase [Rubrobacter sp.]